jgi:hypothetical protein
VLKRFGVSIVVIVAVLAMAAPAAASKAFMAGGYTAEVSGQQSGEHVFTAEAGITVKCKAATLKGELTEARTEVELAPTYGECTSFGIAATVVTEGCKYRLDANANDVDLVCQSGKKITITAATCELQIGSQNGLKSIEYANSATLPSTITAVASVTKIKYTKTKDGIFCPFNGTGEKEDGALTGQTTAKALKGGQIDCSSRLSAAKNGNGRKRTAKRGKAKKPKKNGKDRKKKRNGPWKNTRPKKKRNWAMTRSSSCTDTKGT